MAYGTCPCPEVIGTIVVDGAAQQNTCPEEATVVDNGGDSYTSTCPEGHAHHFDARYLPNVTEE